MTMPNSLRPVAIGFIRKDVAGVAQSWNESQIRILAKRSGYNLAKTVVFGAKTEHPIAVLIEAGRRVKAHAVIVPSTAHFDSEVIPDELTRVMDVISVIPERTYSRWTLNPERWSESSKRPKHEQGHKPTTNA
ncbi:hypothetical protein [Nocardia brasiliensis]|uniref:hypothetical protein n=1 Tax=Nocardia brasiliensis TaxID=37326 RepID=UPI001894DEDB|nr:hypothetical protein [Nocardia brasiliensis]MBF6131144.1 hypothetical protein [Nocardia brasiliensis]